MVPLRHDGRSKITDKNGHSDLDLEVTLTCDLGIDGCWSTYLPTKFQVNPYYGSRKVTNSNSSSFRKPFKSDLDPGMTPFFYSSKSIATLLPLTIPSLENPAPMVWTQ